MGTKYSTNATSGYNTLPPSDDGTVSEANKVKWATLKTKLADPIKTLADTINSELVTHFNNGPSAVTANTTLGASHYNQVIQASGAAVTLTLSDAATLLAGWYCWVRNTDTTESITIGRATAGDTFNGTAADYSLKPNEAIMIVCNAAANGFITVSLALGDTQTFSGARLNIENAAPWIDFRETDQTLPAGKVRIYANGDTWQIEKNTATAGDYSTSIKSLKVLTNGVLETEGAAPWLSFYETDQTLPAGKFRLSADANAFRLDKNTATAGDYSTYIECLKANTTSGLTAGSPTGGDKGAGTLNAVALYDNGNRVFSASNTVPQAGLKTTTADVSSALGGNTSTNLVLTGGLYILGWQTYAVNATGQTVYFAKAATNTAATTYIGLENVDATTNTLSFTHRYVQSSPPYESYRSGDTVPLFVFALLDKTTQAVLATSSAEDPPWANNGPTIINPRGRLMSLAKSRVPVGATFAQQMEAMADFDEWMENPANSHVIATEMARKISQAEKNADMALIPHPFADYNPAKHMVVVLSPTDDRICRALRARHKYGGDSLAEALHAGYIQIDNSPMPGLVTPSNVMAVRARWKLT